MGKVRWERMLPNQVETAYAQRPGIYHPYGLCEPHRPHSPLGFEGGER
jgi:hypothetical protein